MSLRLGQVWIFEKIHLVKLFLREILEKQVVLHNELEFGHSEPS